MLFSFARLLMVNAKIVINYLVVVLVLVLVLVFVLVLVDGQYKDGN